MKHIRLPDRDLDHVLTHAQEAFSQLRGASIFITGASGFVGTWLTQSLVWANRHLGLGVRALLLTRSAASFRAKSPFVTEDSCIELLEGDMTSFAFPGQEFSHVIHAATQIPFSPTPDMPLASFAEDTEGTRRVLELARSSGTRRLLFTSSGAVYGMVPGFSQPICEDYPGAPQTNDTGSAYGQAKRISEWMCATYSRQFGFDATIARLFAFVGPCLPLDSNFAVGNFMRDVLNGGPVRVSGDGTPRRSYLYAADMAVWLWGILSRGKAGRPYNVGSSDAVTIEALARTIVGILAPGRPIEIGRKPGVPGHDYLPDLRRAEQELGLRAWVSLEEGMKRTYDWYRSAEAQARQAHD